MRSTDSHGKAIVTVQRHASSNLHVYLIFILFQLAASVCFAGGGERVLHFPADRSLGSVMIRDANIDRNIEEFAHWTTKADMSWVRLCEAQGEVRIPAGKLVQLKVAAKNLKNIDGLKGLGADDLHMIWLYGDGDKRQLPDDRCMEHISHMTGLKELRIRSTRITSRGLFMIKDLQQLERLWLGEHITDSGMRVVANLKSLKYLYMKNSQITNNGLAVICKSLSLEELEIHRSRVTDEGLAHLAKIRTLKYLMLSGDNFTDAGMAHVKNI